jgi:hypothetical protein
VPQLTGDLAEAIAPGRNGHAILEALADRGSSSPPSA